MKIGPMNIGRLWKTARLLSGLTQVKLSRELRIPQSSVSKYEGGLLEPSAIDWFRFCELVGIDAHRSLNLGVIDGRLKFRDGMYQGNLFGIPLRYRMEQALKIREIVPFRQASIEILGQQSWEEFLIQTGIPDELFFVMDFQVSMNLLFDLLAWSKGRDLELMEAAQNVILNLHKSGLIGSEYSKKKSVGDFLEAFRSSRDHYQRAINIECEELRGKQLVRFRIEDWILDTFDETRVELYQQFKADSFMALIRSMYPETGLELRQTKSELIVSLESA